MAANRSSPHPTPLNEAVAAIVAMLDDDAREFFEERAAIRQFDGGQDRASAELEAMKETLRKFGIAPDR